MYALIMAGGSGTRLWPRSRERKPKQFLDLVSSQTMLQMTYQRLAPMLPPDRVFVVANEQYVDIIREQLPQLPAGNVIGEPAARNTAPAVGLAALHLARLDAEAVMICLPADHAIQREDDFRLALGAAVEVAKQGYMVTVGIKPQYPETGYGYIEAGQRLGKLSDYEIFRVQKFTEKPDLRTARQFLISGNHYWNAGIFIWKVSTILTQMAQLMPDLHAKLMEIGVAIGTAEEREVLQRVWPTVESQSVDFGIMERAREVAVIPADIGWSDVGSWASLFELLPTDTANVVVGEHLGLDTEGCLIYSPDQLVATSGLQDTIIVVTEDAILICPKDRAQDVKELVDRLKSQGRSQYL
ncbi:MAG: mannose-1-phosphate guanylyltransferase [Anaerolineae bacterium]